MTNGLKEGEQVVLLNASTTGTSTPQQPQRSGQNDRVVPGGVVGGGGR